GPAVTARPSLSVVTFAPSRIGDEPTLTRQSLPHWTVSPSPALASLYATPSGISPGVSHASQPPEAYLTNCPFEMVSEATPSIRSALNVAMVGVSFSEPQGPRHRRA